MSLINLQRSRHFSLRSFNVHISTFSAKKWTKCLCEGNYFTVKAKLEIIIDICKELSFIFNCEIPLLMHMCIIYLWYRVKGDISVFFFKLFLLLLSLMNLVSGFN